MRRLKAVTFNVFHDYPRQRDAARRLDLLVDAVCAERPDVVLLQEMFVSRHLGHWTERLVQALRDRDLHYDFFYAPANGSFLENGEFEEGGAVLSRFRIVDGESRRLAPGHEVKRSYEGFTYVEQRIAVRATLEVDGDRIDAFSAHVTDVETEAREGQPSPRALQIDDLARFVADRPSRHLPAIVGADLNARPEEAEVVRLAERGFVDPFRNRSDVLTSDSGGRDLTDVRDTSDRRIDYLFVCDETPTETSVHDARIFLGGAVEVAPGRFLWASDHNGLLADLSFRAE